MGEVHPIVAALLQLGAAATALIAIGAAIEKVWSPMKRWLQDALTNPVLQKMDSIDQSLRARDDQLAEEIVKLRETLDDHGKALDDHRTYVGAHLGPEVSKQSPPLFERVGHLELRMDEMTTEDRAAAADRNAT